MAFIIESHPVYVEPFWYMVWKSLSKIDINVSKQVTIIPILLLRYTGGTQCVSETYGLQTGKDIPAHHHTNNITCKRDSGLRVLYIRKRCKISNPSACNFYVYVTILLNIVKLMLF